MRKFATLLFLVLAQSLIAQNPVILTDYLKERALTDYQVYFYYDPDGDLNISSIYSPYYRDQFKMWNYTLENDLESQDIHVGDRVWFRIIVYSSEENSNISFHLQPNIFSTFGEFRLYQRFDNGVISQRKSGFNIDPREKDINISGSDDLRFYVTPGTSDTLYLYTTIIEESVLSDLTFSISTHDQIIKRDKSRRISFGIFFGIMVIMIIYHIVLLIQVREFTYFYYIIYILAFLAYFVIKEGYIYEIIPQFTSAPIHTFLLELFSIFFLLLARSYLDTRKTLKSWDNAFILGIWIIIIGLTLSLVNIILISNGHSTPYILIVIVRSIFFIAIISPLLAIVPAVVLSKKKFPPAILFLISNLFMIFGALILLLFNDTAVGKHGLELGVTCQIVTFSVGLGGKINLLKRDRELAQRKIIDQLRENAALNDKVNRELEDKVIERTREIQMQKEQIEKQNKEIKYSFDYAKRIQSTVLPPPEVFENIFAEHFIFFKPRDIVSGDFYWMTQKENRIFITASDCTGHGVPGSLMSMLGITMLHEIVNEKDVDRSDEILNELRVSIARTLKQEGKPGEQKDGMDMVMLIYDRTTKELEFSGANNPMYIIRNGEMLEYKGNNMPVAYYDNMTDFTRHIIKLQQGDRIYLFTDGFPDQFGGPDGKKFKYKPFKELLLEVHDRPMDEQRRILQMVFDEWKGTLDQIDDVLVMGLRF